MSVSCKKELIRQPDSSNSSLNEVTCFLLNISLNEVTHFLLNQCFLMNLRQLFKRDFVLVSLGCHEE